MEREITLNGTSVGMITWDPDTALFDFNVEGDDELKRLLTLLRIQGGLTILATGAGVDGLELFANTIPVTNSKFLDQLSLEVGKLGYDLS